MAKTHWYFSVDLDREIFNDGSVKEYTPNEFKKFLETADHTKVNMTLMTTRLITQFDYDFKAAREFYDSN